MLLTQEQVAVMIERIRMTRRFRQAAIKTIVGNSNRISSMCRSTAHVMLGDGAERDDVLTLAKTLQKQLDTGTLEIPIKHKEIIENLASTYNTLQQANEPIEALKKRFDTNMERWGKHLPVYENFVKEIRGFGALNLALTIGITGDLNNYSTRGKVWKRLGIAVIDGERQQKKSNAEDALKHGYNPEHCAAMHVLGECLIKNNRGYYKDMYNRRKDYEMERGIYRGWAHNRAQRYMVRRCIEDVWQHWQKC